MARLPTLIVWTIAALSLVAGGVVAGALVLIPASFDPVETISAGAAPWIEAAYAALAFAGLLVLTIVALRLWHSRRYRAVGGAMTAILAVGVAWACATVYAEYF